MWTSFFLYFSLQKKKEEEKGRKIGKKTEGRRKNVGLLWPTLRLREEKGDDVARATSEPQQINLKDIEIDSFDFIPYVIEHARGPFYCQVLLGFPRFYWVLMGFTWCYWVLLVSP